MNPGWELSFVGDSLLGELSFRSSRWPRWSAVFGSSPAVREDQLDSPRPSEATITFFPRFPRCGFL